MASDISPRLTRYKLNASFSGNTVTHITLKSNLEAKQRRIKIETVWETEDRLGAGAFGVVWRQRADTGHLRAVKVIAREQLNIQEVESLIELQDHPDLFIRFFGWFEDVNRDAVHIAMEYIEHGHLGKYITEYKERVDTKEITTQILEGLVVLHQRQICHRDLKPQNILVASLSPIWVKITDFGISKHWVGTSLRTHCGTAIYRSPEQLGILPREYRAAGNSYTNNIDIWALGAIVHEMLTLEIPFRDTYINEDSGFTSCISTDEDVVDTGLLYGYCHGANPFPCASLRSHGITEDGIDFVKSLMRVNPIERLSAQMALASEWLAQNDFTAAPESSTTTHPVVPPSPTASDEEERSELNSGLEIDQDSSSPPENNEPIQLLESGYQTDTSPRSIRPSSVISISDPVDINEQELAILTRMASGHLRSQSLPPDDTTLLPTVDDIVTGPVPPAHTQYQLRNDSIPGNWKPTSPEAVDSYEDEGSFTTANSARGEPGSVTWKVDDLASSGLYFSAPHAPQSRAYNHHDFRFPFPEPPPSTGEPRWYYVTNSGGNFHPDRPWQVHHECDTVMTGTRYGLDFLPPTPDQMRAYQPYGFRFEDVEEDECEDLVDESEDLVDESEDLTDESENLVYEFQDPVDESEDLVNNSPQGEFLSLPPPTAGIEWNTPMGLDEFPGQPSAGCGYDLLPDRNTPTPGPYPEYYPQQLPRALQIAPDRFVPNYGWTSSPITHAHPDTEHHRQHDPEPYERPSRPRQPDPWNVTKHWEIPTEYPLGNSYSEALGALQQRPTWSGATTPPEDAPARHNPAKRDIPAMYPSNHRPGVFPILPTRPGIDPVAEQALQLYWWPSEQPQPICWSANGPAANRTQYPMVYSEVLWALQQKPERSQSITGPEDAPERYYPAERDIQPMYSPTHSPRAIPISRTRLGIDPVAEHALQQYRWPSEQPQPVLWSEKWHDAIRTPYPMVYSEVSWALQQTPERSQSITGSEDAPELYDPTVSEWSPMESPWSSTAWEDRPQWKERAGSFTSQFGTGKPVGWATGLVNRWVQKLSK